MASSKIELTSSPLRAILDDLASKPGVKYEDPEFPATAASIGDVKFSDGAAHEIVWLRPQEFKNADIPKSGNLFGAGLHPDDIEQGLLTDDYLCASLIILAECTVRIRALFERQIENDRGAYCVTLYHNGELSHVVIDDRIPCDATTKIPIFAHSRSGDIWLPLVEKAFAKVHGGYAAIQQGDPAAALSDLLGCPVFTRLCSGIPDDEALVLLDTIIRHDRLDHVMCCRAVGTASADSGLLPGRWYGLLEVRDYKGEKLFRVRNTKTRQSGAGDWKGRWSNSDEESWTKVASDDLYHTREVDGAFWMAYKDWLAHFDMLTIADVEVGWDFTSCSFPLKVGADIAAVMEVRHETLVSLSLRQNCAMDACAPLRMCIVSNTRPYFPLGGTSMAFSARPAQSTPIFHVIPGKYFVVVEAAKEANVTHKAVVTSYSPTMSINFTTDEDEDVKKARSEIGFVLPSDFENVQPRSCALCSAPLAQDRAVECCGLRVHPWCHICWTCGCELGLDTVVDKHLGATEAHLMCKRCSERKDLRSQKGQAIRADVQKRRSELDTVCEKQLRDIPKADPPPIIDPISKERVLDVLALSKERMKRSYFLRSQMNDADVRSIFAVADHNKSGTIDRAEMVGMLQSSGMCLSSIPAIQKFQVKTVMDEADSGASCLSLKKFCKWYTHANWQALEENMQRLERIAAVFLSFDKNGNATLEREELAALRDKLASDGITNLSFKDLFDSLDKNHTDRIELNEFVDWFQQQASGLGNFF